MMASGTGTILFFLTASRRSRKVRGEGRTNGKPRASNLLFRRETGDFTVRRTREAAYILGCQRANAAPPGSTRIPNHPIPGTSVTFFTVVAPSALALASVSSMSLT
jgi:hypothetical protein